MPLPKIDVPMFDLIQPSTGNKIKLRPFLVKEQKILLMASESNDDNAKIESIKQVLNNCIVWPENFDVETLPIFDLEYIFLQLRAKSIEENVTLEFRMKNCPKNEYQACKKIIRAVIDLSKVEVQKDPNHSPTIPLTDEIGIKMKYPGFNMQKIIRPESKDTMDDQLNLIADCIEEIWDGDAVSKAMDYKKEELVEFLLSLSSHQFSKIMDFFKTMPRVKHTLTIKCPDCDRTETVHLEGLSDFFE